MASSVGGLTNPSKLANTIMTEMGVKTNSHTVGECAEDTGLRNARLNFRQMERTHLMENVIYCELCRRGYAVDVGVVHTVGPNQAISKIAQYRNQISTLLGVSPLNFLLNYSAYSTIFPPRANPYRRSDSRHTLKNVFFR